MASRIIFQAMNSDLPLMRLRDWPERLADLFKTREHEPFKWGTHDCCIFAADAVLAVTGYDPAADLRDTYSSATEAAKVLERFGGVAGVAIKRAGRVVSALAAQPGDIGLSRYEDDRPTLAVWGGNAWHVAGATGLVVVPTDAVLRAWRCTSEAENG